MSDLRDLYQEVIIEHGRRPRHFHVMPEASHKAKGRNPLCGDVLDVYLLIENDKIKDISFEGSGCAISLASASLMTESVIGKSLAEVLTLFNAFHDVLVVDQLPSVDMGKLAVLFGVKEFPVRVKCATLAWHTLKNALENQPKVASTETDDDNL